MLSRQHRVIFVHIPKTGGQSVETVFLRSLGLTWEQRASLLLRPNDNPNAGPLRLAHMYASEYVKLGYATPDEFSLFFKFAVVRNPWARVVSSYKYHHPKGQVPFDVFVQRNLKGDHGTIDPRHLDPQVRYLCGETGKMLVDRVVRYENIAVEFAEVSQQIFGTAEPLPSVNVSRNRRGYRSFYTIPIHKIVEELYRDDIEMFGYEFDDG